MRVGWRALKAWRVMRFEVGSIHGSCCLMDSRSIAEGAARCRGRSRFLRHKWPPPESGDMSSPLPTSWDSRATGLLRYQHGASPHELGRQDPPGLKDRSILCAFDIRSTHPNGSGLQPSIHPGHETQAAGLDWYGFWPLALKNQHVVNGEDKSPQSDLADEARPNSSRFLDSSRFQGVLLCGDPLSVRHRRFAPKLRVARTRAALDGERKDSEPHRGVIRQASRQGS